MNVLLHVDVATTGEFRVLVADLGGAGGLRAVRILGAVDEAEQIAVVENLKPCTSSTIVIAPAIALATRPASSKQTSRVSARMWNSRSPGVDGA